jgi:hypothetical protein
MDDNTSFIANRNEGDLPAPCCGDFLSQKFLDSRRDPVAMKRRIGH